MITIHGNINNLLTVGVFLKSESIVEHRVLIEDKILTHSKGYVKKYDVLDESNFSNDLIRVTISADVIMEKLKQRLISENILKVEGQNLFAESYTKIEKNKDVAHLLFNLFEKYPYGMFKFIFDEPTVEEGMSDEVVVTIKYILDWDKKYLMKATKLFNSILEKRKNIYVKDSPYASIYFRTGNTYNAAYNINRPIVLEVRKRLIDKNIDGKIVGLISLIDKNNNKISTKHIFVWRQMKVDCKGVIS